MTTVHVRDLRIPGATPGSAELAIDVDPTIGPCAPTKEQEPRE